MYEDQSHILNENERINKIKSDMINDNTNLLLILQEINNALEANQLDAFKTTLNKLKESSEKLYNAYYYLYQVEDNALSPIIKNTVSLISFINSQLDIYYSFSLDEDISTKMGIILLMEDIQNNNTKTVIYIKKKSPAF